MQVNLFGTIHQTVTDKSAQYLAELSRHNYVTPTRYILTSSTSSSLHKGSLCKWLKKRFASQFCDQLYIFPAFHLNLWFCICSYLELLGTFNKVLGLKKTEIQGARNRTKTGLDKVSFLFISSWNFYQFFSFQSYYMYDKITLVSVYFTVKNF